MKKALLVLLLAALAFPVFSDDALVLPKGVLRTTIAPNYGFGNTAWNKDGETSDISDDGISFFNLGLALEYGINDWVTAAVQWAPGWNIMSDYGSSASDAKLGTFFDVFVGAKFQIVGPKAPVQRTDMRFAVAPGIKVPMPAANAEDELDNLFAGDEFIIGEADKHAFGLGARLYFDYIVNPVFFINLFSEFIYYLEKTDEQAIAPTGVAMPPYAVYEYDIEYGFDWIIELEPQFGMPVADGLILKGGLPLTYKMTPDIKINGNKVDDSGSTMFSVGPNVALFFTKTAVPFELKLQYKLPLFGTNTNAVHNIALQGKVYLKF
jgi:hypothetical protein